MIRLGAEASTVLFLGLGDASPGALRRAGAALARRLPAGRTAVTTAVLDEPGDAVEAFTEGLLLGSYQFTMKSAASPGGNPGIPGTPGILRRSGCCWPARPAGRPWSSGPAPSPVPWPWPVISRTRRR